MVMSEFTTKCTEASIEIYSVTLNESSLMRSALIINVELDTEKEVENS